MTIYIQDGRRRIVVDDPETAAFLEEAQTSPDQFGISGHNPRTTTFTRGEIESILDSNSDGRITGDDVLRYIAPQNTEFAASRCSRFLHLTQFYQRHFPGRRPVVGQMNQCAITRREFHVDHPSRSGYYTTIIGAHLYSSNTRFEVPRSTTPITCPNNETLTSCVGGIAIYMGERFYTANLREYNP